MSARSIFLLPACVIMAVVAVSAKPRVDTVKPRPVLVGGFAHADSCTSTGTIRPMRKDGDGFVAVRIAPDVGARELDRLKPGRPLWLCRDVRQSKWVGVVYPEESEEDRMAECGVSENAHDKPAPYSGPCRSGWVARHFIELSAG